jgi:release factor glutamine methyltransferase
MRNEMPPTLTFLGSSISYTQNVLTPRLETEALVLGVIRRIQEKSFDSMLDVGTGSGAIAISLKRMFPYIPCFATDISELALQMAQQNAQQNGVDIRFEKGDLLEPVQSVISGARTCCIANLPYIPLTASLPQDVREEDPEIALYGGET